MESSSNYIYENNSFKKLVLIISKIATGFQWIIKKTYKLSSNLFFKNQAK
jgi:hypothetical protein